MHNHAAFKRADVEDARRGHPASELSGYAAARGLEPIGRGLVGHLAGLNPRWEDYAFNGMRGELVPGRFGVLQHELYELGLGDDADPSRPGTYHGMRARTRMTWRSFVPLGELFEKPAPDEPFAAQSIWLPTTSVKVLVPEIALLPPVRIESANSSVLFQRTFVPGFAIDKTDAVDEQLIGVIGQVLGPSLTALQGQAFVEVRARHGALGITVDGYRDDPAELDHLVGVLGAMAEALTASCAIWHERPPQPFSVPLRDFDPTGHPAGYQTFDGRFDRSGMAALEQVSTELGLRLEDPVALHRRFPRLPIPGTSLGVLAGTLPGTEAFGRLTWHRQGDTRAASYLRRGVIVPAAEGAAPTPPGGVKEPASDCWVAVADGLACAWPRAQVMGKLGAVELVERGVAALRATGAAEL